MYQDGFDGPAAITTNMTIKTSGKSMTRLLRVLRRLCRVILLLLPAFPAPAAQETGSRIPVLLYHRFGPVATDSMTVTTAVFESHLKYLQEHGYVVIPLRDLVAHRLGKAPSPPDCSVAIAVDDGHRSVHAEMHPLILQYRVPVTLFVYPSAISNASYAMTWDQLRELARSGLYDIQSHTYWHPNFKTEKRQRTPQDYARFADAQLARAKEKLEKTLGSPVDMLAWPFGIHDADLMRRAAQAGYVAAFTIERRHTAPADHMLAMPRYLITNSTRGKAFERLLAGEQHCSPTR